jgi:hypothetical protein
MKGKTRSIVVYAIIFVCLVSVVPAAKSSNSDDSKSALDADKEYWMRLAENAWCYFQPGVGVDTATGLHYASNSWHYFTGWDMATYLFAIMDGQQLGLLSADGEWGFDNRVNKILTWLQTMQLTTDGVPYLWYESSTGRPAFGISNQTTNISDYGNLLIALHSLQMYRPDLANTIDYIVKSRINSSYIVSQFYSYADDYNYYVAHGFESFGFSSPEISNALNLLNHTMNQPPASFSGIELPKLYVGCESLLLGMFHLEPDPLQTKLMRNVYLAHEARYNFTDKFTAMSEGNTGLFDDPTYVYEWVVTPSGAFWKIEPTPITPIAYLKTAVGFLALYNTSYAEKMVTYLEPRLATSAFLFFPASGYKEGIDENGRVVGSITDKTNGLILDAALYVVETNYTSNQPSSVTPTPTETSSTDPTLTPKPSPSDSPTPTNPSPTITSTPNSTKTPDTPAPTISPNPTLNATSIPTPLPSTSNNPSTIELDGYVVVSGVAVFCLVLTAVFVVYFKRRP